MLVREFAVFVEVLAVVLACGAAHAAGDTGVGVLLVVGAGCVLALPEPAAYPAAVRAAAWVLTAAPAAWAACVGTRAFVSGPAHGAPGTPPDYTTACVCTALWIAARVAACGVVSTGSAMLLQRTACAAVHAAVAASRGWCCFAPHALRAPPSEPHTTAARLH